VTHSYGLDHADLAHVLVTFPIVPDDEKRMTLDAFRHVWHEL
jgi:hypothetical protein